MISIIIPLYNKVKSITQTLNCVMQQSYQDFEVVVVDDGSTDGSIDVVHKFLDERIRVVSKSNGGVSSARNVGIKEAKYNYIALLDADDYWEPNYLEEQVQKINPKATLVRATNSEVDAKLILGQDLAAERGAQRMPAQPGLRVVKVLVEFGGGRMRVEQRLQRRAGLGRVEQRAQRRGDLAVLRCSALRGAGVEPLQQPRQRQHGTEIVVKSFGTGRHDRHGRLLRRGS